MDHAFHEKGSTPIGVRWAYHDRKTLSSVKAFSQNEWTGTGPHLSLVGSVELRHTHLLNPPLETEWVSLRHTHPTH
jgi:hypothetical protein